MVMVIMEGKFYLSLMIFVVTALFFPTMYTTSLNANITDTGLKNAVQMLPVILLVLIAIFPIYYGLEGKQ